MAQALDAVITGAGNALHCRHGIVGMAVRSLPDYT